MFTIAMSTLKNPTKDMIERSKALADISGTITLYDEERYLQPLYPLMTFCFESLLTFFTCSKIGGQQSQSINA